MSDFDQLMKDMKQGLNELAEDAQKKYGELINYLDSHNADEIKNDLKVFADKAAAETKEQFENAKKEIKEIDLEEKVADVKEDIQEGLDKAKTVVGEGLDVVQKQFEELRKRFNL